MLLLRWLPVVLTAVLGGFSSVHALAQSDKGMDMGKPDASQTDAEPERFIVSTGQDDQALAALRPDQAVWLETDAHGRVLALLERERARSAKGAIIILADRGQTADTGLTGALREPLAESGWAAMSLGLPQLPEALLQWRNSAASSSVLPSSGGSEEKKVKPGASAETDNSAEDSATDNAVIDVMESDNVKKVRDAYRARLTDHLATAAQTLKDRGYGAVIFVGIGHGADAVTAYLLGTNRAGAVVWVAPELTTEHLASLAEGGGKPEILDLISTQSRGGEAAERRSRLRRGSVVNYQQQVMAMPPKPQARDARQIAQRITGWARSEQ